MSPRLSRVFTRIVALRAAILSAYALLIAAAVALAAGIRSDAGISGLIVPSDPDYIATRDFEAIFPERPVVILLLEADDPWRPEVLAETEALEGALRAIPGVVAVLGARRLPPHAPGVHPDRGRRCGLPRLRDRDLLLPPSGTRRRLLPGPGGGLDADDAGSARRAPRRGRRRRSTACRATACTA